MDAKLLEKIKALKAELATLAAHERDEAWLKAAQDSWEGRWMKFEARRSTLDEVLPWSANLLRAELKLRVKHSEIVEAHRQHLKRLKGVENICKADYDEGKIARSDYHPIVYYRIEAEIWLEAAKAAK